MKIANLTFLIIITAVLFVGGNAQETVSKSLRLTLQVKETERLCVGKPFTISARLENLDKTNQIIDKKSVWRFYMWAGPLEKNADNSNDILANLEMPKKLQTGGGLLLAQNKDRLALKPKEFYEDTKTFAADDAFFNLPGKYQILYSYYEASERNINEPFMVERLINSNWLEFTLADCKTN